MQKNKLNQKIYIKFQQPRLYSYDASILTQQRKKGFVYIAKIEDIKFNTENKISKLLFKFNYF